MRAHTLQAEQAPPTSFMLACWKASPPILLLGGESTREPGTKSASATQTLLRPLPSKSPQLLFPVPSRSCGNRVKDVITQLPSKFYLFIYSAAAPRALPHRAARGQRLVVTSGDTARIGAALGTERGRRPWD